MSTVIESAYHQFYLAKTPDKTIVNVTITLLINNQ